MNTFKTKFQDFSKAKIFIIDSHKDDFTDIKRKKYITKKGFLRKIKSLGLKTLDSVKTCKTNTYSCKGIYYVFIWE